MKTKTVNIILIILIVISIAFGIIEYVRAKAFSQKISEYEKTMEVCNKELAEQKELADKYKKEAGLSFLEARRLQKMLGEKK